MIVKQGEKHKTVLLEEAVDVLQVKEGDVIVDATLGAGGHTLKLLEKVGQEGKVIAFDLDGEAIQEFGNKIKKEYPDLEDRLILVNDNFKNIQGVIEELYAGGGIKFDKVNGILADLGWRIEQIRDRRYGMSFQEDAPLNMKFDLKGKGFTAREVINEWSAGELKNIFMELGGETYADKISREIVKQREIKKIESTLELAGLIGRVKKDVPSRINPATKVFQALRIVVNEELSNLNIFLEQAISILESKGRLAIISFHSLEDRLVKDFFRAKARGCVCPKEIPVCVCDEKQEIKIISTKGIIPGGEELKKNNRSRSARLRIAEKQK